MLKEVVASDSGRIFLSIILGFGLATMFRKACTGNKCIVIQGPPMKDIKDVYYKIDDDCYKYTPIATKCV